VCQGLDVGQGKDARMAAQRGQEPFRQVPSAGKEPSVCSCLSFLIGAPAVMAWLPARAMIPRWLYIYRIMERSSPLSSRRGVNSYGADFPLLCQ
jgi:hypothetical protein